MDTRNTSTGVGIIKHWKKGLIAALLLALVAALILGPAEAWITNLLRWIEGLGAFSALVFGLVYVGATVALLPGSILTIGAGFLYGLLWGTVLVSLASTTGALLAFLIGRYLGARSAMIEQSFLGGDCLVHGCVPSKALLRSARAIQDAREVERFGGVQQGELEVDFPALMQRMRKVRAEISHHDAVSRFRDMGVDVYLGRAHFTGPHTVEVDGQTVKFKKALISTGASAWVPPVKGVEEVDYFTNKTIFSLTELPKELIIVGHGPIGCELGQAFQRFGSQVTILEMNEIILPRMSREARDVLYDCLTDDGVEMLLDVTVEEIRDGEDGKKVVLLKRRDGDTFELSGDCILFATGRRPNVDSMGLENAGVDYTDRGITVDDRLRTSQRHIFAAGDVASNYQFTHSAEAQAKIALQNALFFGRKKSSDLIIPMVIYTDPELAHVGLTEKKAGEKELPVDILRLRFEDMDRAIVDGETRGLLKVVLRKDSDEILGTSLVARHAGEIISHICLAMKQGIGLKKLSDVVHPYPTQAEIIKRAGDEYNRGRLKDWMTPWLQRFFAWRR